MTLKSRIQNVEKYRNYDSSGKCYIHVALRDDEDADTGLARHCKETGIAKERVGYAMLVGKQGLFELDFGGYKNIKQLMGYNECQAEFAEVINHIKPTLGPPRYR